MLITSPSPPRRAMLSYPDPHKFEQIRSQWESTQPPSEGPPKMVGRREKSDASVPVATDANPNPGPGKFRRKLSHGFSFISNPLSQRRVTPNHQTPGSSVSGDVPTTALNALLRHEADRLPPSSIASSSTGPHHQRTTPQESESSEESMSTSPDLDPTPKPLPRSRTMTFLPRLSRSGSTASIVDSELGKNAHALSVKVHEDARATPSKIPTPTPPAIEHRRSSPRQYVNTLSTQEAKFVAAGSAFAGGGADSPSRSSVRFYTTPNLLERTQPHQPQSFMVPRRPSVRKSTTAIPVSQKMAMKENNNPNSYRYSQKLAQIKESSPRVERSGSPATPKRRSSGLAGAITQSKQSPATRPTASKRRSSQVVAQTPLVAQRALAKKPSPLRPLEERPIRKSTISQPRLMGPLNPPTPPTARFGTAHIVTPRASNEKDLQNRTFTTPSATRIGRGLLSRDRSGVNFEVRTPSSSTLHALREDSPPPIPSIPEKYHSCSMPVLPMGVPYSPKSAKKATRRTPKVYAHNIYMKTTRKYSDIGSVHAKTIVEAIPHDAQQSKAPLAWPIFDGPCPEPVKKQPKVQRSFLRSFSNPLMSRSNFSGNLREDFSRPWPIKANEAEAEDFANNSAFGQVKDYMPCLYWAGRFQSRFDQWRTEAMNKELDPEYGVEEPLGACKLSEQNEAACHIFLQLRELCVSNQAADSLWEFEYKYRQDHNMLNSGSSMPPLKNRKHDDGTSRQGPIGRAVRKLTPRKSSFVNLLKGKGWVTGKEEEMKSTDGSSECHLPATRSHASLEGPST